MVAPLIGMIGRLAMGAGRAARGAARLSGKGAGRVGRTIGRAIRGSTAYGLERNAGVAGRWLASKIESRPTIRVGRSFPTARRIGIGSRPGLEGRGSSSDVLEAIENVKKRVVAAVDDLSKKTGEGGVLAAEAISSGGRAIEEAIKRVSSLLDEDSVREEEERSESRVGAAEEIRPEPAEEDEKSFVDEVVEKIAGVNSAILKKGVPLVAGAMVGGAVTVGTARAGGRDRTNDDSEDDDSPLRRIRFRARKITFDSDFLDFPAPPQERVGGTGGGASGSWGDSSGDQPSSTPRGSDAAPSSRDFPTSSSDESPRGTSVAQPEPGESWSPSDDKEGGNPSTGEADYGEAPARLESKDDVRQFWNERNKRAGARLYDSKGEALVDEKLLDATAEGIRDFEKNNPNYRVETYGPSGGLRHSGSTSNHGAQGRGMAALTGGRGAALDVVIIDKKTGKMLTNHPGKNHQNQGTVGENAPIYQELFNRTVMAGEKKYPGFRRDARSGAYFAGGSNAMDLMHIDVRGRVAPQGGGSVEEGFTDAQMKRWGITKNVGLSDVETREPKSTVAEVSEPRREVEVRPAPNKPVRYSGDSLVARAEPSESGQKVQRKMGMKNQENEVDVKKKGMTYNQYFGLDNEEAD